MKTCIAILLVFISSLSLTSQDFFIKPIGFDSKTDNGNNLIHHKDRLFALIGHFCDNLECGSIAELSMKGDTLWVTRIPDIDVSRSTIAIYGDTITVTGNNDPFNTLFRMAHFDLDGNKLGETIEIDHPKEKFIRMFQLSTVRFDNTLNPQSKILDTKYYWLAAF